MSSSSGTERHKPTSGMAAQAGPRQNSQRGVGLVAPSTWAYSIATGATTSSRALWTAPRGAERQSAAAAPVPLGACRPEPWVTKRELAAHLHVALRWIESQHHNGLPHVRRGGVVRYRISEVEAWLRGEPMRERA